MSCGVIGLMCPDQGDVVIRGRSLSAMTREDLLLVLLSGGGSSLLALPFDGISMTDFKTLDTFEKGGLAPLDSILFVNKTPTADAAAVRADVEEIVSSGRDDARFTAKLERTWLLRGVGDGSDYWTDVLPGLRAEWTDAEMRTARFDLARLLVSRAKAVGQEGRQRHHVHLSPDVETAQRRRTSRAVFATTSSPQSSSTAE